MNRDVYTAKCLSASCPNHPNKRNCHKRIHGCIVANTEKPNRLKMITLIDEQDTSQIKGFTIGKPQRCKKPYPTAET